MGMDVLMIDEVSMMDVDCWKSLEELLSLTSFGWEVAWLIA